MRVAILTSVSSNISDIAMLTLPNKIEYCLKHDYSLIIDNSSYEESCVQMTKLIPLFYNYDMIWTLDADTLITNMNIRIEQLSCLWPNVTVCEDGLFSWELINCGSMVWKNTQKSKELLQKISYSKNIWEKKLCIWQTWLGEIREQLTDTLTIAPIRCFNSCVTWANGDDKNLGLIGTWEKGDFVYHACGLGDNKIACLQEQFDSIIR